MKKETQPTLQHEPEPVGMEPTENSVRKVRGRPFKPGQSGNPAGKPRGTLNHATRVVQALIDGQADALVGKALELALSGDGPVLRAMLDRLCPPRKDSPVIMAGLPKIETAADLPKATAAILAEVTAGRITPGEGHALAGLLDGHRRAVEITEIEARLTALEKKRGKQ